LKLNLSLWHEHFGKVSPWSSSVLPDKCRDVLNYVTTHVVFNSLSSIGDARANTSFAVSQVTFQLSNVFTGRYKLFRVKEYIRRNNFSFSFGIIKPIWYIFFSFISSYFPKIRR
jgi:hypothetical protein